MTLLLVLLLAAPRSPYLAQHASDPVQWHEYSEAAFAKAKKENKPIFLSVGYSTCHWCHVMQRESFSDPEIGKLMNDAFVNVLVDREERPDVDSVYIAVTRALTGDAGWPNNVILTPDGKPFFAAAYLNKETLRALIPKVQTMWRDAPQDVTRSADMVMSALRPPPVGTDTLGADTLEKGYRQLAARYDAENGGFLPPPKFPSPHHLMFLLRYWKRTGDAKALAMVEQTLTQLRARPIYDAQRFGFHRYASDAAWREPHFEKMLNDQAVLAIAYLEAYQATHKKPYADVAREIFTYVLRDLKAPNGAFFTAHDSEDRARRDEKILTDWNGLMIAALAFGSAVLDDPSYAKAATRAADAVWTNPRRFLDDYTFLVWGLLNLYEATFDARYLERAIALEDEALRLFRDKEGRYYVTSTSELLVRPRDSGDGATPSGNSVQLMNLTRLAHMTARDDYKKAADALIRSVADEASLAPVASTHLLSALDFVLGPSYEVVLSGKDVSALRRAVFANFVPNKVLLSPTKLAPFTELQKPINKRPTAYICTNYLCKLPTTDPKKVTELLR
ncbi:MAG TPA: thioredoxin domain-containing protein [Thermoanaerobaculia bacterium]|nr:thioredoxin domain-containing protein [Thermoanaerobaculia bacterium]